MLDDFILNPHLAPFIIMIFAGAVLGASATIRCCIRTKTVIPMPSDFKHLTKKEKKMCVLGTVLVLIGIAGYALVAERYGYNRVVYDLEGNRRIESSKTPLPPGVSE